MKKQAEINKLKREVSILNFKMDNPPKYKVGDKVDKERIVTRIILENKPHYYVLSFQNIPTRIDHYWSYELVNIRNGETSTLNP